MKAHTASLIHAIVLIALSGWGYLASGTPSVTAMIPVAIGIVLLFLNKGIKAENKVIAHIAVLLTLLVLFGLIKPLTGALGREDTLAMVRVSVMILATLLAMVYFVKSFVEARKNRAGQ
jgi:hypothetical protein